MPTVLIGKRPPEIASIHLDLSTSEAHRFESRVTQFPVEDGSPMTDHIQNLPDSITLEGFVTNSPIQVLVESGPRNGETAFEALEGIHRTQEPVRVFTTLKEYDDMALVSLNVPKTAETGDALRFTAMFQKMRKVSSQTVQVEDLRRDSQGTDDRGSDTNEKGNQNTPEPKPGIESLMNKLFAPKTATGAI